MYNDAGVTIYAYKTEGMQKNMQTSDEELDYMFNVAAALGATRATMELPAGADADAMLKRMAAFAEKHKVAIAYHSHLPGEHAAFDRHSPSRSGASPTSISAIGSRAAIRVDRQSTFSTRSHDRIASVHLKDRTTPPHCALNLPWGEGETPIKDILQTIRKNKWKFPASIELEYAIPEGSDAVAEVRKCVDFCRQALKT